MASWPGQIRDWLRACLARLWRNRVAGPKPSSAERFPSPASGGLHSVESFSGNSVPVVASEPQCSSTPAGLASDSIANKPWMKLVGECVDLFDELDSSLDALDPGGREMGEHVCLRLREILQRCGVDLIEEDGTFERTLHQPVETAVGPACEVAKATIISPGFRVGRRILRRARVKLNQGAVPNAKGGPP